LPVHGFVLAGGRSTRMGQDKALLRVGGRTLVEIAVEKLRSFCAEVGIAGNRNDLARFAPVVHETRRDAGPGAGVEAGLLAATQPWVLFVPVDAPLVPAELLRRWCEVACKDERDDAGNLPLMASFLCSPEARQPAFCLLHKSCLGAVSGALDRGERRLAAILFSIDAVYGVGALWVASAARFVPEELPAGVKLEDLFLNVNTPQELAEAEAWAGFIATSHPNA